jgi:hypothetical protein
VHAGPEGSAEAVRRRVWPRLGRRRRIDPD